MTGIALSGLPVAVVDLSEAAVRLRPGMPSQVVASINESVVRLAVFEGEGDWHRHETSDELFLVLEGELRMDLIDTGTVTVGPRQAVTIPAGVLHRPWAVAPVTVLCFKHLMGETEFFEVVPPDESAP